MAGGYLGKISAVISANTGDYVRGLNEGAKATRDFAKTVQSTLNRSATEAARAFEGIYTPLQQFERAIRQAGALRLNFKGFEGAVRNINDLQKRLNGVLTSNEIDLIVRTSGLKDIQAVKDAINSLNRDEIKLVANAGGLGGLLRERADMQARGLSATRILDTSATAEELDALIAKLDVLDDRKIELIIDIVNQRGLDEAITRARRLQDAATNIAKPFAQATQTFNQLAGSVQTAFIPAFARVQDAVERLGADLESNAKVSSDRFEAVRQGADKAAAAVARLAEAQRLASSGATGRELGFVSPRVVDELRRSSELANRAAGLPASAIAGDGQIAGQVRQLQNLRDLIQKYNAEIEQGKLLNVDTTEAQKRLDAVLLTSQRLRDALSERIAVATADVNGRREADEIAVLQYRARAEAELEAKRTAALKRAEDQEIAILQYRARAEADLEARRAAAQRKAEDDEIARLINRERAAMQRASEQPTPLAGNRDPQTRVVSQLRGEIETTRRLIGGLSDPLREQLGPEVDRIDNAFKTMARSGIKISADEARRLSESVAAINASLQNRRSIGRDFSQQFGGAGAAGLGLGVDQRSLRAIGAQIEFVQTRLASLAAEARGPVLSALQLLREAGEGLFSAGRLGTEEGQRELDAVTSKLIKTLAAAEGISEKTLEGLFKRVGDVSRGGFDRFSLGIQQAAFAVEDFFSVTGGLDQRVRAAGNNISQLGFILGGTSGLIAGIAGAIGSQLIVALIKWANAGRTTEDQMKAVNDVLSRQKSLVEELADAFRSLGDSIGRNAFSAAAQEANDFRRSLEGIRRKQQELRDQRAFSLDEGVIQARADVNVARNRLERATTRDEAVAAQRQLDEAQRRLDARQSVVRNRPAPTAADARRAAVDAFEQARDRAVTAASRRVPMGGPDADPGAIPRAIAEAQQEGNARIADLLRRLDGASVTDTRNVLRVEQRAAAARGDTRLAAQLEELINSLEESTSRATDELARSILEGANDVGAALTRARAAVDDAIAAGIPGARGISAQLNAANAALSEAATQLENAQQIRDVDQRTAAVDAARQTLLAAEQQAAAINEQAERLRDATESLNRFSDALDRVTQAAEANLNAAEGRRDRAREEALGRPTPRNQRALERAERDVRRQEELRNNARREARLAEERARQDPQTQAEERRIRQIDQLLSTTGVLAPGQREALIQEQENLRVRAERRARQAVDNDPRVRDARDASIREEQRQQMVAEGRNLLLTDGQRARIELDNQIASVQAATGDRIAEAIREGRFNDIAAIQADQRRAEGRLREDAARQAAPTIFGLADQVANAVLQGPSRAALAPTDVTTMEGSRELTRLLRGDDASRNQDLVNLQREANRLLAILADNPAGVAP